ncbi:MAG: peptidylprolyl isomerase [Thermodesulfovibrionales bacterium]
MKKKILLLVVLIPALIISCTKKTEQKAGTYVAKVGKTLITEADVEKEFKNLPPQIQKVFEGKEGREKFIDELVKKEMLYQEAKSRGLENDAEYKQKLEDFKKLTMISLLLQKEIEDKVKVGDNDAKAYYDSHKEEFMTNNQIRASHILVKTEEEAKSIFNDVKKGADFAKLAQSKSIDSGSAKNGGDLGYFSRGQMVPEFESVAFKLKVGEISKPVRTQYGYHIIKVTEKKEGKPIEFDKIKDLVIQKLTAEKQKEVFDSYIEGLKKKYNAEIKKEALSSPEGSVEKK